MSIVFLLDISEDIWIITVINQKTFSLCNRLNVYILPPLSNNRVLPFITYGEHLLAVLEDVQPLQYNNKPQDIHTVELVIYVSFRSQSPLLTLITDGKHLVAVLKSFESFKT